MSRYDGLIIPRSYSEYINKTDAATLSQALQLNGVLAQSVSEGNNAAVTSNAVNVALSNLQNKKKFFATEEQGGYFKIDIGTDNACLLSSRGGETWIISSLANNDNSNVSANSLCSGYSKIGGIKARGTTIYFYCSDWAMAFIVIELVNNTPIPKILYISESEYNSI